MRRLTVNGNNKRQYITLEGDPKKPEPEIVSIRFPGGEVSVTRTTKDDYWAHCSVFKPGDGEVVSHAATPGRFVGARLDHDDKHAAEVPTELQKLLADYREGRTEPSRAIAALALAEAVLDAFDNPEARHFALLIEPLEKP